ncbi:MAG TPA: hypothetical protein VKO18_04830 [Terriglobia bacterium]|nr:hypothetical protein [Terriglobia bacterium]
MKTRVLVPATVLMGIIVSISPARATTMVSMSMEQLTQASSDIVQARVVNQASEWNATHTQIVTITTLAVSQTLKGSAPSTVQVRQLGGTVGNMTVSVPGDVAFRPQGEYVLFLEPADGSNYHVVGMTQGAYPVYQDAMSKRERVVLPANLAQIQSLVSGGGNPVGTVPLVGFHKYVTTLINAGIQIPHGLSIPLSIAYTESRGVGRAHVYGKTTAQLFPNKNAVIPLGTEVEGEAVMSGGSWTIHWDEVSVRGVHAQISAISHESEGSLRGRNVILNVR